MNPTTLPLSWHSARHDTPRSWAMIIAVRNDLFGSRLAGRARIEKGDNGTQIVCWSLFDASGSIVREAPLQWAYLPEQDTRHLCDILLDNSYWQEVPVC